MNKLEKIDPIIIICNCHSTEHQLIIHEDEDEIYSEAYVHIHLTKRSFFSRLKYGLKYIFGYQCKYGAFDEVLLSDNNTKQLYYMLKKWHE